MKSRVKELVEKSVAAMVSAIEIYNKPDFKYREETFSILAVNAWELLLKAKWLCENDNKIRSLYVFEQQNKVDGTPYKYKKVKLTTGGNPFTHGLDYLSKKIVEKGFLPEEARRNLKALIEIRDSSVHFYHKNPLFSRQLQEVGCATVKNFVQASQEWFETDLSKFNFYLMPLAFIPYPVSSTAVVFNKEEKKVANYIQTLDTNAPQSGLYFTTVHMDVQFSRSKTNDAISVHLSNDPQSMKIQLTDQQFKDRYPLTYDTLTKECKERYIDFKQNQKYHTIRKPLKSNPKYCIVKYLDPDNPKSPKQDWYSRAIFTVLDNHYKRRD